MDKVKKENIKKTSYLVTLSILCGAAIGSIGGIIINNKKNSWKGANYETFVKYKDYFYQTPNGTPLRLRDYENPIPFLIEECDDQTKNYILDGIRAVDEVSEKINYVIYDNEKFEKEKPVNYIKLNFVEDLKDASAGETKINYNKTSGEIYYPIQINIENKYKDGYWNYEETESLLTTIVTHEVCHTLGLNHYNDSIMEAALNPKYKTMKDDNITPNIIKYCYDDNYDITITHPVDYKISYKNNEKKTAIVHKEDDLSL